MSRSCICCASSPIPPRCAAGSSPPTAPASRWRSTPSATAPTRMLLDFYADAARLHGARDRRFRDRARAAPAAGGHRPLRRSWASSRRCSRTTPSTTAAGRGSASTRRACGAHTRSDRCSAPGRPWPSAATGPSRPSHPCSGSTPPSRGGRWTEATPAGGSPRRRSRVEQALRAYTAGVAYRRVHGRRTGVLRPGMLADVTLLDRDIFAMPADSLNTVKVVSTVAGGRIVYGRR